MSDFLVFFGSSEGFNFETFDKDGRYTNFNRLFPDFEHFESKVFSTDRVDNKPILAKYKLKAAGKSITLLKYYTFAQSSFSSRVEGSNIGVAFLSEDDLQLNKINYILLKNLLLKFQQKSLNNNKFITGNFSNEALAVFQEFKDTNSFAVIEKKALRLDATSSLQPCGFFITEANDDFFKKVPVTIDRVYLTADNEHLKRVYDNTSGRFNVWFFENNKLISLKEKKEIKALEDRRLNQTSIINSSNNNNNNNTNSTNTNSHQNELLKTEFNQLKNKYKFVLEKNKILTKIIITLSILLLISLLFNIFKGGNEKKETATSNTQEKNTPNIQFVKPEFNDIAFSFMDSIVKDKEKLKNFTSFLLYINNSKNENIRAVTFDQFYEIKSNFENEGILDAKESFFKKHQISLTKPVTSVPEVKKNNNNDNNKGIGNNKKSTKKDSIKNKHN